MNAQNNFIKGMIETIEKWSFDKKKEGYIPTIDLLVEDLKLMLPQETAQDIADKELSDIESDADLIASRDEDRVMDSNY